MTEKMIEADGVELCTEAFGDPTDPPILLVMGLGASMLWWEDDLCTGLADGGRFVVRYDHRDTGRSCADEPGHPGYTGEDLAADLVRVLDAHDLPAAHLVGVSAGGAFAQAVALDHPDRVLSLALISTTPAVPGDRDLPGPTPAFLEALAEAHVDWTDERSVIDHLVGYSGALAGDQRPFDEPAARRLIERDVARTGVVASLQNHDLLRGEERPRGPLSAIAAPTLVIHGTADPLFPLAHGEALADEIPNAELVPLEGAGHGLFREDWDTVLPALIEHTKAVGPASCVDP